MRLALPPEKFQAARMDGTNLEIVQAFLRRDAVTP
jgi:hypothetical protein